MARTFNLCSRPARVFRGVLFACVAAAVLAACSGVFDSGSNDSARKPDAFDTVRGLDLLPRYPQNSDRQAGSSADRAPRAATYYGQDESPTAKAEPAASGEGYELNFDNAPATTVAKVILGDILGAGYTIDPRIQGTVSLSSGRPIPKRDLLFVLESALRMSNAVLISGDGGYRIIPAGEAVGAGKVDSMEGGGRPEPGYGITVLPVRYVSAQTLLKLVDSFATKPGTIRADTERNVILIQGNGAERRAAVDTIMSFDVDWMKGQSVGIYPVKNATPETVITELEKIMATGESGLNQSLVKFQAVSRLNAILVVSRKPSLLSSAQTWIARLDDSDTTSTGVKVYRVRYGDARQIAEILNDVFTGRTSGGLESATNQIAPGAGLATTSSGLGSSSGSPLSGGPLDQSRAGGAAKPQGDISTTTIGTTGPGGALFGRTVTASSGSALLPNVRITADTINNALLIYSNQENYRLIERTLQQLDRPQLQVSIDATIAEISLNDKLAYGVQYFIKSKDVGLGKDKGSAGLFGGTNALLSRALPGFNFLVGPESDPRAILDALNGVTTVKVLSSPSVVVLDNQVATLQVGDQVPIVTRTATSVDNPTAPVVNNIDYRNTGVILRVVPRINVNGNVMLNIEQEISNVANNTTATTLTPTVSQRKIKSAVSVASGQTVLLGGLISERQEKTRSGIPLTEKLGPIGDLFAHNDSTVQRTELIVFIRPQIIRDGVDAYRVAEELRSKLKGSLGTARSGESQLLAPVQ